MFVIKLCGALGGAAHLLFENKDMCLVRRTPE